MLGKTLIHVSSLQLFQITDYVGLDFLNISSSLLCLQVQNNVALIQMAVVDISFLYIAVCNVSTNLY